MRASYKNVFDKMQDNNSQTDLSITSDGINGAVIARYTVGHYIAHNDIEHMKIVCAELKQKPLDIALSETNSISEDMHTVTFYPKGINIDLKDWLVEGR